MSQVTSLQPGSIVWAELSTPEVPKARVFYSELFGWSPEDQRGGSYTLFRKNGGEVAALSASEPKKKSGSSPQWSAWVSVLDLNVAVRRAKELGGRVLGDPVDVRDAGRMAVVTDPTGGTLCLWQVVKHRGFGRVKEPGAFSWLELMTRDLAAAERFYTGLFGWTARSQSIGGMQYTNFYLGGEQVAGMMRITPDMGRIPAAWALYFGVERCDESTRRAVSLGGKVMVPSQDVSGVGRFSTVLDPTGGVFSLFQPLR